MPLLIACLCHFRFILILIHYFIDYLRHYWYSPILLFIHWLIFSLIFINTPLLPLLPAAGWLRHWYYYWYWCHFISIISFHWHYYYFIDRYYYFYYWHIDFLSPIFRHISLITYYIISSLSFSPFCHWCHCHCLHYWYHYWYYYQISAISAAIRCIIFIFIIDSFHFHIAFDIIAIFIALLIDYFATISAPLLHFHYIDFLSIIDYTLSWYFH